MRTGFVWHERCMWHDTGRGILYLPPGWPLEPYGYVENPDSKRRMHNLIEASGLGSELSKIEARRATIEELTRFHDEEYIQRVERLSNEGGGTLGESAEIGRDSFEIARFAAGGCLNAVDAVVEDIVDNAYCLVRPPGHHAESNYGRGFCVFNNIVLAAMHARDVHKLERIAVVDWDVHHGNGTQGAFYDNSAVLTVSLHQDRNYPQESGAVDENGEGQGKGFNVNVPLPPGSGSGAYLYAFERLVLPALEEFKPSMIFVASGFDASAADPLGRMMLYSDIYRRLATDILDMAERVSGGRVLMTHEGGYSAEYVPFCGLAVVEAMRGERTDVKDPFQAAFAGFGGHELTSAQKAVVENARSMSFLAS